jgi:hypothetical protein
VKVDGDRDVVSIPLPISHVHGDIHVLAAVAVSLVGVTIVGVVIAVRV